MIRLLVVSSAAIGLILFVAFVVSRLLRTRTRGVSIRLQVFVALALIVGTFAFGLGLMVIDRIEARAVRLAKQAARDEAVSMVQVIERTQSFSGYDLDDFIRKLSSQGNHRQSLSFELISLEGRVLFPNVKATRKGVRGTVSYDAPLHFHAERVGSVRVIKPTIVMQRLLADFAPTVLVISLVLGAAAALAAAWIGKAIGHPIEIISRFAERVSQGERARTPAIAGGAREVVRLSRAIDSMRRQLEGRPFVETFAADLSHELKNPVAAIRAAAEVLQEGALDEPQRAHRFVERIREASGRIERLLKDLVNLARIEARGVESLTPVDMSQIARAAQEHMAEHSARFSFEADADVRVRGDSAWIGRAMTNLIDNALIHSEQRSKIEISVRNQPHGIVATVANRGQVSRHVRERLFKRFVTSRADKGGSGLGLAIVRAVAEAHGGQVLLSKAGPPLVQFELVLPAVTPQSTHAPTPREG